MPLSLTDVIEHNYCIGCGICTTISRQYTLYETAQGLYQARAHNPNQQEQQTAQRACPFSSTTNEDQLANALFPNATEYHQTTGRYTTIYTGHQTKNTERYRSSSGGILTWLAQELLIQNKVDGIIHVRPTKNPKELFAYKVSRTAEEVAMGSSSHYYPIHLSEVIKEIRGDGKQYALIGLPCFIKATRLLAEGDPEIKKQIIYYLGLFCGHLKSKAYTQLLARQLGHPKPTAIHYRRKKLGQPPYRYNIETSSRPNGKSSRPAHLLYGTDWGLGLFKPKACDWCDDVTAETADLSCGDAWLPEFKADSLGNSQVIIRDSSLQKLLEYGFQSQKLHLQKTAASDIEKAQLASFRHRRKGLAVRQHQTLTQSKPFPKKRYRPSLQSLTTKEAKIYRLRMQISERSLDCLPKNPKSSHLINFWFIMLPLELKYYLLYHQVTKYLIKKTLALAPLIRQLFKKHP